MTLDVNPTVTVTFARPGVPGLDVNATTTRFVKKAAIEEAPLNNELMLFDPATSNFYVLNPTMTFTWRRISDNNVHEIARDMQNEFEGCTAAQAESDVQKAIEELIALGLLTNS